MSLDERINLGAVHRLEEEFHGRFLGRPSQKEQSISDRVRRCLSWLKRAARVSDQDTPSRFVDLWIGLNALYGQRSYNPGRGPNEKRDFQHFLNRLSQTDHANRELSSCMKRMEKHALGLISNKYLWNEFWRDNLRDYEKRCALGREMAEKVFSNNDASQFFFLIFPRLLVLRNQIFHGSSSENTEKSRDALIPALFVLEEMLPVFIRLMIHQELGEDWPPVPYPGKNTPQHPE